MIWGIFWKLPFVVGLDIISLLQPVMKFKSLVAFTQVEFEAVAAFAWAGSA